MKKIILITIACLIIAALALFWWRYVPLTDGNYIISNNKLAWHLSISNGIIKTTFIENKITGEKFIPFIIETSGGVDRGMLAILSDAYTVEPEPKNPSKMRVVLKMHPRISPIKVGVFPLVKKDNMPKVASEIARELRKKFTVFYDEKDSIGRRYRRQDEAGTPFCVTVDGQTFDDDTVTIRERDTLVQVRVKIDEIAPMINKYIENWKRNKGISLS